MQPDAEIVCLQVAGTEQERGLARLRLEVAQAAPLGEIGGERLVRAIGDAVAEPEGGSRVRQRQRFEPRQRGPPVNRPWLGLE